MDFNGLLSQIKNLMPPLLKQPTVSKNHIYEIANKTTGPQRNTNDFDESTSNWHILLTYIPLLERMDIALKCSAV